MDWLDGRHRLPQWAARSNKARLQSLRRQLYPHYHGRLLSFDIKKSAKSGITRTTFDVYDIIETNGEVVSDFAHHFSLVKRDETKRFEFLLLVTLTPEQAEVSVRPKQWKSTSRFRSTGEAIHYPREAHNGPFLNTMMITRSEKYPDEPAERVALVYIPMRYWDVEEVVRETVIIGWAKDELMLHDTLVMRAAFDSCRWTINEAYLGIKIYREMVKLKWT